MTLFKKGISEAWLSFHMDTEGRSAKVCGYRLEVAHLSSKVRHVGKRSGGARNEEVILGHGGGVIGHREVLGK